VSGYVISQILERVRLNSGRLKKTTIVALARKFLVTLWKHLTAGIVLDRTVVNRPQPNRRRRHR
jgi:hypothetical protein